MTLLFLRKHFAYPPWRCFSPFSHTASTSAIRKVNASRDMCVPAVRSLLETHYKACNLLSPFLLFLLQISRRKYQKA
jgi:hypothetical protein